MILERIRPCPELKAFVKDFWIATWDESSAENPSTYFATANSIIEVVFAYKAEPSKTEFLYSSIQGQTTDAGQYPADGFHNLVGVSIYTHSIPFLFDIPASALINRFTSLETLLGNEGKWLEEKMSASTSSDECIHTLDAFLKSKLRSIEPDPKGMATAAKSIRQTQGNINIEKLSAEFCFSHKQFNRLFSEFIGFNPKLFARIVRFENALDHHNSYDSLTKLAYAYGYHDQSHFIREFKRFSGYPPKEFFRLVGY